MMADNLLEVNGLTIDYELSGKSFRALDAISFNLERGCVIGVAGESGCGKSTLGLSVIGLLPGKAKIRKGEILFEGRNLVEMKDDQMNREIRGRKISMIFQSPQTALNPVFKIETQMVDVLRNMARYQGKNVKNDNVHCRERAIDLLRETGIADPAERISNYPFEFSGGMKQRVMIAMALSSKTSLLIADEPTTSLDVTIGAQIIVLLKELSIKHNTSILYICHDLGILSEIADHIMIMYAGRIFERGKTLDVLGAPRHPYTAALLESLPGRQVRGKHLLSIPGHVPSLDNLPPGCSFHSRCRFAEEICRRKVPPLVEASDRHWSACVLVERRGRQKWG